MKELFAAFAVEVFRPIITLVIPGIWAIAPGLIAIFLRNHVAWQFVLTYRTPSALVFLTTATAVGMILENFCGELENYFFDKHGPNALRDWYEYLALPSDPDLKAFSYIRTYVLRLKFEGGMAAGSVGAVLGTLFLHISLNQTILYVIVEFALMAYFVYQVKQSTKELVNVRKNIIRKRMTGVEESDASTVAGAVG